MHPGPWSLPSANRTTYLGANDSITGLKVDVAFMDLICLAMEGSAPALTVTEDIESFGAFVNQLSQFRPGVQHYDEWFAAAALPAFATNPSVNYRRMSLP